MTTFAPIALRVRPFFSRLLLLPLLPSLLSFAPTAAAQSPMGSAKYAMRASATAQASPAQITLTWFADPSNPWDYTPKYSVHRRNLADTSWTTTLVSQQTAPSSQLQIPAAGKISFTDNTVAVNTRYEYRIMVEDPTRPGSHVGYGYVLAGINIEEVEDRGTALLVVDDTIAPTIASKLDQFKADLIGDGWRVERIDVARHDQTQLERAQTVRNAIKARYDTPGVNLRAAILIGHVPVPYSGVISPDGHVYPNSNNDPNDNHRGAWPADVYYADMTGTWTDSSASYTNTKTDPVQSSRLTNLIGDKKFDQNTLPGTAAIQVGRIDFANLPVAGASETALLSAYLDRDHAFRHRIGAMDVRRKALISDRNGSDQNGDPHHAYCAPGYRSFSPALNNGGDDIEMANAEGTAADGERWITKATANTFLFSYAFGAGGNDSVAGQGTTTTDPSGPQRRVFSSTLVAQDPKAVFTLFFGSWFGDWDQTDNLMRAMLASDYGLTSMWGARPTITLHQMGLGETIGAAVQIAQNNQGTLHRSQVDPTNASAFRSIHIALLGDPTLRAHPVRPVTNATRANVGADAQISWSASTDSSIVGYNVYRASSTDGPFAPAPNSYVTGTSYTDPNAAASNYTYMVRAVKLEASGSGTYYNLSQGVIATGGTPSVATPTFSPASGTYSTAQSVTISTATSGATIRYTTDGSAPSQSNGTIYSGAVNVASTTTLKAIAYKAGMTDSSVASATYTIETAGQSEVTVTAPDNFAALASDTDTAQWRFSRTNAGSALTINFSYSGTAAQWTDYRKIPGGDLPSSLTFAAGESEITWTIRCWNNVNNANPHYAILTLSPNANYTIGTANNAQINFGTSGGSTVATPAFSPGSGTYSNAQSVTISTTTSGATIRYTTDGSTPSQSNGTIYSGAVNVASTTTLKAIAYKSGMNDSSVASATYTIGGGLSVVTVTAPDNFAALASDTDTAQWRFSRTNAGSALTINFSYSGTAAQWTDYRKIPGGDLPSSLTFAAGESEITWTIRCWNNVNNANPHYAILTLSPNANYTIGTANSAQINFGPDGGPPVVTITAPDNTATIGSDTNTAQWRFSRTGSTASALTVYLQYSGTAAQWTDYRKMPGGDLPSSVTIPAGEAQVTWTIRAWSNVNNANPQYAICTVQPNAAYVVGSPNSAQINISP